MPQTKLTLNIETDDADMILRAMAAMGNRVSAPAPVIPPLIDPAPTPAPVPPPEPVPAPPVDANVYPLTMPPVANPGDPVTIGTGPNEIGLRLNASAYTAEIKEFAVILDGRVVAGPLTCTGIDGMTGGQIFRIRGMFGPMPHRVRLAGTGAGMAGLWINSVTFDYLPLVYNGGPLDNRGTKIPPNSESVWANTGASVEFGPRIDVAPDVPSPAPLPAPVITADIIAGARIDGIPTGDGTLPDLVDRLHYGETLSLPAGTFRGASLVTIACTIEGHPSGTILDGDGMSPAYNKACLVPTVAGVLIQNLTFQNWHIPASSGGNACAVRQDADGIQINLLGVTIRQCDNGLLTFGASDVTLDSCHIHDNGVGADGGGATHETYHNGGPGSVVNHTDCIVVAGAKATHALKSRAEKTVVFGGSYTGNAHDPGGAYAGAVIDVPNGGYVLFSRATLTIPAGDGNTLFLNYGADDDRNPGREVRFGNAIFHDQSGTGGIILSHLPDATLDVTGSIYTGDKPPQMIGWANVVGEIVKAAP